MGQRHQLFVIAKIGGRYRCLSAIHHQWLYGFTAVKRCLGLLKIFEDPSNRLPIEQELISARKYDDAFWEQTSDAQLKTFVPFPFITTCLVIGASFDATEGYHHSVSVEPWGMAYDEGDNNNGITILDITEPNHVRYCFVDFHGMESQAEVPLMTPLPAHVYLRAYYPEPEPERWQSFEPILQEIKKRGLIDVASLSDTWSEGSWEEPDEDEGFVDLGEMEKEMPALVPTLETQALDKLVDLLMNDPDDVESIFSTAALVGSFVPRLKDKVYKQAGALNASLTTLRVVVKALERETMVDLSPFVHLSATFVSDVINGLQKHGKMESINLSNSTINPSELMEVLSGRPTLKALYVLATPNLSIESLLATIEKLQIRVHDIYHTDLLKEPLEKEYPQEYPPGEPKAVSGLNALQPVVELVWVTIGYEETRPIDWSKLKPKTSYWGQVCSEYVDFSLGSTPLSQAKLMTGLINAFTYALRTDSLGSGDLGSALASSLASGKSSVAITSQCQIGPLSSTLFTTDRYAKMRRVTLAIDKFAIIAINDREDKYHRKGGSEPSTQGVRYAFVTPKADSGEYDIMDVPQYLDRVAQIDPLTFTNADSAEDLKAYWAQQLNELGLISQCSDEDALAIARKVFKNGQEPDDAAEDQSGDNVEDDD